MITGFTAGTRVKWNNTNAFETGVVVRIFRQPADVELGGKVVHVDVSDDSPAYLVMRDNGEHVILSHRDVMLQHVNAHT